MAELLRLAEAIRIRCGVSAPWARLSRTSESPMHRTDAKRPIARLAVITVCSLPLNPQLLLHFARQAVLNQALRMESSRNGVMLLNRTLQPSLKRNATSHL